MMAAARQAGVTLRVYETFVYYAPALRAREMIEAGEIGELRAVRLHVNTGTADNLVEGAAVGLVVALQREAVRRRPARV